MRFSNNNAKNKIEETHQEKSSSTINFGYQSEELSFGLLIDLPIFPAAPVVRKLEATNTRPKAQLPVGVPLVRPGCVQGTKGVPMFTTDGVTTVNKLIIRELFHNF